jgi:anaerobic selenocysteine-containing dehydrogenase
MEHGEWQGALHDARVARRHADAQARRAHGDAVLTLMTMRAHDQFNTTVYSSDDRYRGVEGDRRVVFLNAGDLAARGLRDGDRVDVECAGRRRARATRHGVHRARVGYPAGCCAAYYPEASGLIASSVYSAGSARRCTRKCRCG